MYKNGTMVMNEKIILITGATDGLGKQTALQLAQLGATLLIHGRNFKKLESVRKEIIAKTGNEKIKMVQADFQSLSQVKQMAEDLNRTLSRLDVLINNAGVFMRRREMTEDGFEMTFGVNHLAPFLLTNLLLNLIKSSAPARIINVSSMGHRFVWLNLKNMQGERFYWGWVAYCRSKLINILFTRELAERLRGSGICANAIHPGTLHSNLTLKASILMGITAAAGAESIVKLATGTEGGQVSGMYFNRFKPAAPSPVALNQKLQKIMWEISEEMVGRGSQANRGYGTAILKG